MTNIQKPKLVLVNTPDETQDKVNKFIDSIPNVRFFQPDNNPKPSWKVYHGNTLKEARDAAIRAIPNDNYNSTVFHNAIAAIGNASRVADYNIMHKTVVETTYHAAMEAAEKIGSDILLQNDKTYATERAEYDAAHDAARDAVEMARQILISDLECKNKEENLNVAKDNWDVWQKGYGLAKTYNGVFYVYYVREPSATPLREEK